MSLPVVYISGPITQGNRAWNYYQACEAEKALMRRDVAPINPMRSIVLPDAWGDEFKHDDWMRVDLAIIERCDMVVRLPGESFGADDEVKHAHGLGILVWDDLSGLGSNPTEWPWDRVATAAHAALKLTTEGRTA